MASISGSSYRVSYSALEERLKKRYRGSGFLVSVSYRFDTATIYFEISDPSSDSRCVKHISAELLHNCHNEFEVFDYAVREARHQFTQLRKQKETTVQYIIKRSLTPGSAYVQPYGRKYVPAGPPVGYHNPCDRSGWVYNVEDSFRYQTSNEALEQIQRLAVENGGPLPGTVQIVSIECVPVTTYKTVEKVIA